MKESPTILIVDDEPSMLRYLQTVLEADDYRVETAGSGQEAVTRVQRGPAPQVVLLDLLMPEVDGLQTLEMLRQARPGLKVVMLSCVTDPRKVVKAIRLGASDYLTKPFQKAELDAVLEHTLTASRGVAGEALGGEDVEDLGDDLCFIGGSSAMRKIRAQV